MDIKFMISVLEVYIRCMTEEAKGFKSEAIRQSYQELVDKADVELHKLKLQRIDDILGQ